MMGPAIIGNAAVQVNVMVNTNFASSIADPVRGLDGPVSWLGYAFRFMQLPLGLFGVAMASATLPSISRSAAAGNFEEFRRTLSKSLGMVFLLTIPSSVGLWILGKSIIGAIYQGGHFQVYDTDRTAVALSCYAVGLFGYAAVKVLNPAFYALGDARTPMAMSLFSIAINLGMVSTLIHGVGMGVAGLALTTSAVALFNFVTLFWILRNKVGGIHGRELVRGFLRVAAASAAMGAAIWVSTTVMTANVGTTQLARLADLAVSMPLGLTVFYTACKLLGVDELDMAISAFVTPIKRRLGR
jgi:putative peptidoglycan lipid II flippase